MRGELKIFDNDRPEDVYLHRKNVICNGVTWLFARLFLNADEPLAGVWGLAVGQGGVAPAWSSNNQPEPVSTVIALVSEIKRKILSSVTFLDVNGNPTTALTTSVAFSTIYNATTDGITVPLREMGLIGGGTELVGNGGPTNMLTAGYFDPTNPLPNSVVLINYLTIPPFLLPPSINMNLSWTLNF